MRTKQYLQCIVINPEHQHLDPRISGAAVDLPADAVSAIAYHKTLLEFVFRWSRVLRRLLVHVRVDVRVILVQQLILRKIRLSGLITAVVNTPVDRFLIGRAVDDAGSSRSGHTPAATESNRSAAEFRKLSSGVGCSGSGTNGLPVE